MESLKEHSKPSNSARISKNFFLHIHPPKTSLHSLNPAYSMGFGIMLASLFVLLLLTGILLLIYYTPSVERAYYSVKDIMYIVPAGRIIRNIHRWSGHAMVLVSFLHLLRVFFTSSYLRGRKLNWVIGIVLLILVMASSFSGYLLPWDQLAFWAITIGSNIAASFRELTDIIGITDSFDIGGFVKRILIGGEDVSQASLSRFFSMHVIFLPLSIIVLMGYHFWRIRRDGGMSKPDNLPDELNEKVYSWPNLMWAELAVGLMVLAIIMVIAFFIDAPLREMANPDIPENPAKAPWYFLGIQELVSYSAFTGGIVIPILFLYFLFSLPYRKNEEEVYGQWFGGKQGRKITFYSVLFSFTITSALIYIVLQYGWFREWNPTIQQWIVMIINPATVAAVLYYLWAFLIRKIYRQYHLYYFAAFTCMITGFVLFTIVGIWLRGPNWEAIWQ